MDGIGDNEFTLEEIESLFEDETQPATPPVQNTEEGQNAQNPTDDGSTTGNREDSTKAFAKRLRESTEKAVQKEREAIAKSLGYDTYDAMMKSREHKTMQDKGLDPEIAGPVLDELVRQRMDSDPRMLELENFRKQQVKEFGKRELAEITELTGGEITELTQLPKEVIDLWGKKGSLKAAWLEHEGAAYITRMRSEQSKGSMSHMSNLSGSTPVSSDTRSLTPEERRTWKFFNPQLTDDDLDKITVKR